MSSRTVHDRLRAGAGKDSRAALLLSLDRSPAGPAALPQLSELGLKLSGWSASTPGENEEVCFEGFARPLATGGLAPEVAN